MTLGNPAKFRVDLPDDTPYKVMLNDSVVIIERKKYVRLVNKMKYNSENKKIRLISILPEEVKV